MAQLPPLAAISTYQAANALSDRPFTLLTWARRRSGDAFRLPYPSRRSPLAVLSSTDDVAEFIRLADAPGSPIERGLAYARTIADAPRGIVLRQQGDRHEQVRSFYTALAAHASAALTVEAVKMLTTELLDDCADEWIDARRLSDAVGMRVALSVVCRQASLQDGAMKSLGRARFLRPGSFLGPSFGLQLARWRAWPTLMRDLTENRRALALLQRDCRVPQTRDQPPGLEPHDLAQQTNNLFAVLYGATASAVDHVQHHLAKEEGPRHELVEALRQGGPTGRDAALDFCSEVRRLSPTNIGYMRTCNADVRLREWELPADSLILVSSYLAHRNAGVFRRPHSFSLGRFTGRAHGRHEYFPFGDGEHRCVGQRIATNATAGVLEALAPRFDACRRDQLSHRVALSTGGLTRRARPMRLRYRGGRPVLRRMGARVETPVDSHPVESHSAG
ncbi:MAG: cytochrome P450 [Planctomycetota bacterium]